MEQKIYYEDYELGSTRTTIGRTITEADIVLHAGQTGDFFPHHMDAEFAKTTEFGKRIAHGTLTFSVAVGSTANVINPVAFSYGYDHLRFIRPVFIGDTIHTKVTIHNKEDHKKNPNMGIVTERLEVINQNDETVLVAFINVSEKSSFIKILICFPIFFQYILTNKKLRLSLSSQIDEVLCFYSLMIFYDSKIILSLQSHQMVNKLLSRTS